MPSQGGNPRRTPTRDRSAAFVKPIPTGTLGQVDQGIDISAQPGAKIVNPVPGTSKLVNVIPSWFQGQPLYVFQVMSGAFKNRFWYAAEQVRTTIGRGSVVPQGGQIGVYAPSGTATEFGWAANASGETLTHATHPEQVATRHSGAGTTAGNDFAARVRGALTRAPAGTGVSGWKVKASQESDGGDGSCGPIGSGGIWYSELSTIPMGTASDFHALGNLPCGTALLITNPANGKSVTAHKRDVGAGSAFLPVMGLYPATARALGLSGGVYTVIISRPDGGALHPVRGTQVSGAAAGGANPITRPGGGSPDTSGQAVDKLFADYEAELNAPRTAPSTFAGKNPFAWWWQSFSGRYANSQGV